VVKGFEKMKVADLTEEDGDEGKKKWNAYSISGRMLRIGHLRFNGLISEGLVNIHRKLQQFIRFRSIGVKGMKILAWKC
jgi:hypothetical protein